MKGRVGWIHSWIVKEKEKKIYRDGVRCLDTVPDCVYVKFKEKDDKDVALQIEGTSEPGLYPIILATGYWNVDRQRQQILFKTQRIQLPFGPVVSMTAHASQGQTFAGRAIVDLRLGGSSSSMGSYVAFTRVNNISGLVIYRPLNRHVFTQKRNMGLGLLL